MPPSKRNPAKQPASVPADEKIARLLGMLFVRDLEQKTEQVTVLRSIGFEVAEVAAMLGITENHVKVAAHHGRKNLGMKRPKK